MLNPRLRSLVFVLLVWSLAGCATETVALAPSPPPPTRTEVVPARPDTDQVWVPGEWAWRQRVNAYVWMPGRWDTPPSPGAVWVRGDWSASGGGYTWVEGHWKPR